MNGWRTEKGGSMRGVKNLMREEEIPPFIHYFLVFNLPQFNTQTSISVQFITINVTLSFPEYETC